MKHAFTTLAAAVLIGSLLAGCEEPVVMKPAPPVVAAPPQTPAEITKQLEKLDTQFGSDVAKLPGGSTEEHRAALVQSLDELASMIRLIDGSNVSPLAQNSLSIITNAAATAGDTDVPRRRMEAAGNEALHATRSALGDLVSKYFSSDDQLPPMLQALDENLSMSDSSVGPMHDLDATNTFTAVQAVIDRITYDMMSRYLSQGS